MGTELLTVAEMYRADGLAIAGGVSGQVLMDNAGAAVADAIRSRWNPRPVVVLCGPGNNGGDGFVIARRLAEAGWPVRLGLLGARESLKGDAADAAERWTGLTETAETEMLAGKPLVVDALFGAGLTRPLEGTARVLVEAMAGCDVVAVDVPSGVHGDSGAILGTAPKAALTVTFFRRKPGHLLLPGRALCGATVVADIGIPESALDLIRPKAFVNAPSHWSYPWPRLDGHKYQRGHALVLGGGRLTGAARLASRSALRAGAGLVTIACPAEAFSVYAAGSPSVMVQPIGDTVRYEDLIADPRRNALLLGPGCGAGDETQARVTAALSTGRACVLDADALTSFASEPESLLSHLHGRCLLTPHDGEFSRLFDTAGSKPERTARAAARCGAVVLLKGPDTVIAAPDGRLAINANAPPDLATAGSGDVLAGVAVGLMAAGMPAFEAACAAAWLHGEAANEAGPGLIADDLPEALRPVLRRLKEQSAQPCAITA